MTILIDNETDKKFDFDTGEVIRSVIEKTLQLEACPYEVAVNVLLTDDEEVRLANKEFRDLDRPTDVLSFPAVDYEAPSDFTLVDQNPECYMDPENDELLLGDIMVSLDKVVSQAKEYGHSEKRELAFLIAHSILHLLGYDHMEAEDRKIMEEKQETVLALLGIVRGIK